MQVKNLFNANLNSLDFSFKTSTGDKINLSMYDNKSVSYNSAKTQNSSVSVMTLTHEYGYNFSYEGNGLDANDIAEINEALKTIQPQIDEFMKNINEGFGYSNQEIVNLANSMKKELPSPKDLNHANAIADKTLKLFDELLKQHKANQELLNKSNKLFENLLNQTHKFSFYV
ncbi:ATP/GTP-binding protein [Campylobacter majalis]|uniref:ATP/GTP-binding protein n=1 Tax=Campylobacter majalis TaxID=2790656 RepID=UPI003D698937